MIHPAADEPPLERLGRYRLIGKLGSGGMAHVHLGVGSGLAGFSKLVVLKVMQPQWAKTSNALNMFLGEARLAARLHHPNIVQTLEVGEDNGCYFIGMEYLEGLPLGALTAQSAHNPLPLGARLEIVCQVLDGLSYLHQLADFDGSPLGLVHQDLSPSNIFVTFDGIAKILDFGVAKAGGLSELSVAGCFIGKVAYAAPEQTAGESDARSDVFAMGLVLWELLSGLRLTAKRTQSEIFRSRIEGAHVEVMRSEGAGLPPELLEICIKAAATDATERYPSASALRDALRSYMLSHSIQSSPELLRELLTERFDEQRRAARQRIDQRLQEVQRSRAMLSSAAAPQSPKAPLPEAPPTQAQLSQAPQVFVKAPQRRSPSELQSLWKRGFTALLACGLGGGVGAGLSIAAERLQRPSTEAVISPALAATGVASASAASERPRPLASTPTTTDPEEFPEQTGEVLDLAERTGEVLEVSDLPREEGAISGGRPRASARLPIARRPRSSGRTRKGEAPVGSTEPMSQDVNSLPPVAAAETPTPPGHAPGDPSSFVRSRKSTESARPIDGVSPYAAD